MFLLFQVIYFVPLENPRERRMKMNLCLREDTKFRISYSSWRKWDSKTAPMYPDGRVKLGLM